MTHSKDKEIWQAYSQRVTPVGTRKSKKDRTKKVAETIEDKVSGRQLATRTLLTKMAASKAIVPKPIMFERSREKALRDGDITIDAKIDLHGMIQNEAHDALAAFIRRKTHDGSRHLLVITGKGRSGDGVLRHRVPQWLQHFPEAKRILAIRPAALRHGGAGAFYVIMRRKEKS